MAKFSLDPNPTFQATVEIPLPGGEKAPVKFTFKHRDRDGLRAFMDGTPDKDAADVVLEAAAGWDLDDEFNAENVKRLVTNYLGAGRAVYEAYVVELAQVRLGN